MVIIKCNAAMPDEQRRRLEINIHDQAADGIIVLPCFCELLDAGYEGGPDGGRILILQDDNPAGRVAELEQELARAMFYISAQKACATCKHENTAADADACLSIGAMCALCNNTNCRCESCRDGSNWEWVGVHGSK